MGKDWLCIYGEADRVSGTSSLCSLDHVIILDYFPLIFDYSRSVYWYIWTQQWLAHIHLLTFQCTQFLSLVYDDLIYLSFVQLMWYFMLLLVVLVVLGCIKGQKLLYKTYNTEVWILFCIFFTQTLSWWGLMYRKGDIIKLKKNSLAK